VTLPVLDLFSGAGGWDLAARELGLDPIGVEKWEPAISTRGAAGFRTLRADVAALDPHSVAPFGVDGLIASPPCAKFSLAGKREGLAHPEGRLVYEPLRWARALLPRWCAWEQVPPVLPIWRECAIELEALGYSTWCGVLRAEQYGVPQTRKRAILIARRGWPVTPPQPSHSKYYPRDPMRYDNHGVLPWISMADALAWGFDERPSPTVSGGGTATGGAEVFANAARSAALLHTNRDQRENGARLTRAMTLPAPTFTGTDADRWYVRTRGDRQTPGGNVFDASAPAWALTEKARSWTRERPATTIVSSFGADVVAEPGYRTTGGASRQENGVRVTPQEAALLQSFPSDFPWRGSRSAQFQQIGNAIPPLLALAILRSVI
jgi:DNA (cytosine-5)-methyltransferase 1